MNEDDLNKEHRNKESRRQNPGLYVHVPFCRSKCLYCDFYSTIASPGANPRISDWLRGVCREMVFYKESFQGFDSLFLGGGAPSILGERELAALFERLREHFTFLPGPEITIECNPDDISDQKLKVFAELGVNRISLGVQSLDDNELKYLGRGHDSLRALEALDAIRSCGFANLGVDLIHGLENQTLKSWKKTLDQLLEFEPEHISCYQLTIEEGSAFRKMKDAGRIKPIGEKLEAAFFIWTSRYLERRGYLHYEISNFAKDPESKCRHNLKYWDHSPYLGLGPSAHSFQDGKRWWNVRSTRKYRQILDEGKAPVEASEILSGEQLELESISLGLRTSDGVDLRTIRRLTESGKWIIPPGDSYYSQEGSLTKFQILAEIEKSGLIRIESGKIKPTLRGFLVADGLPLMFCG